MSAYEQIGDEIFMSREDITEKQTVIIREHYCYAKKLVIEGSNTTVLNAALPLTVKLLTWEDQPVLESLDIKVTVGDQEITLSLIDGAVVFDFVSAIAGEFTIMAQYPNTDGDKKVVTVS